MTHLPNDICRCTGGDCGIKGACARYMDRPTDVNWLGFSQFNTEITNGQCRYFIFWCDEDRTLSICPYCEKERIVATSPTTGCCDGERSRAWTQLANERDGYKKALKESKRR